MRTLVIGRSPFADIVIAEASVASHHAEMVVTGDERYYLTDCGAATGTWLKDPAGGSSEGEWQPVRQTFVSIDDTVRVGDHVVRVADMLSMARRPEDSAEPGTQGNGSEGSRRGGFRGRIERDPATGEIIRRRP